MSTADERPAGAAPVHGSGGTEEARDAAFAGRARDLLLDSAEHLDARTRSRLTRARHAALEQLQSSQPRGLPMGGWLAPAGGLAAVVIAALVWVGMPTSTPVSQGVAVRAEAGSAAFDDLALMADAESLELAEEIEFYAWLEAEADLPAANGGVG